MAKYVTVPEYAKMCKTKRSTIYERVKAGKLKLKKVKVVVTKNMIDIEKYPPTKYKKKIS